MCQIENLKLVRKDKSRVTSAAKEIGAKVHEYYLNSHCVYSMKVLPVPSVFG
jgi:hypothetical protein